MIQSNTTTIVKPVDTRPIIDSIADLKEATYSVSIENIPEKIKTTAQHDWVDYVSLTLAFLTFCWTIGIFKRLRTKKPMLGKIHSIKVSGNNNSDLEFDCTVNNTSNDVIKIEFSKQDMEFSEVQRQDGSSYYIENNVYNPVYLVKNKIINNILKKYVYMTVENQGSMREVLVPPKGKVSLSIVASSGQPIDKKDIEGIIIKVDNDHTILLKK